MKTLAQKADGATAILRPEPAAPAREPLGEMRDDGLFISKEQLERLWPGDPNRARKELRLMLADLREREPIRRETARPPTVRFATPDDELPIYRLLELAHAEFFHFFGPINPARVAEHIQAGTRKRGGFVAVIDDAEGMPIATCGLVPAQWYWSNQFYLQDLWQFVHPAHRRGNHAAHLLAFENWLSDEMTRNFGYEVYLVTGVLSMRRHREKTRLFSRHTNPVGATFLYPMPPGMGKGA